MAVNKLGFSTGKGFLEKVDKADKADNATKINNLEITVDENGVLGYLPKIVVTIGGEGSNSDGMSEYELFYDGNLQIGQKLYYNNEEAEVTQFVEDEDFPIGGYYWIFCSSTGAFASASGTTITVELSNQRVVIPQRKLAWSGSVEVTTGGEASIPVSLSEYHKIEVVFAGSVGKYTVSGLLTPFVRGYLVNISSALNDINIEWINMSYNTSEKTLSVSKVQYYSSSLSEIAVKPIVIKEIYEIIE